MIRQMTVDDIDKAMPLCREHFELANMCHKFYTYENETAKKTIENLVKNESCECLVSENDGTVDGLCIFAIIASPMDVSETKAIECLWYAKTPRLFVRLFEEMESSLNGVHVISVGVQTHNTSLQKYLKKKGFVNAEINYARRNKQ